MNAIPKDLPHQSGAASAAMPSFAAAGGASDSPNRAARPSGPVRWRLALLMLIAVYPLITAILYVLMPLTDGWALWQRTLLLAPVMIVSIVYGVTPFMQKRFAWFLLPQPQR
jgi:antibiotic biosynthesis monooxygenase (ABM) superfamily enzyme